MNDHELRKLVQAVLDEELKKPKKDQQSAYWLSCQIVDICEREFTRRITQNLSRLFIEGDFAERSHSHTIE